MNNWKSGLYTMAAAKDFETKVNNYFGLIREFSLMFEELVNPIRQNYKHIEIKNTFDTENKQKLLDGSFVPEFSIQNTIMFAKISFEYGLVTFESKGRTLLTVKIDSGTTRVVGEAMDRLLMEQDFNVLLENAFSNSIE